MPPKRRKLEVPESEAPEPKKRVTRSSAKANTSAQKDTEPEPIKSTQKASNASKKAKQTKQSKQSEDIQSPTNSNGPTTLTIQHESLKNPLTCHKYTPSPASKSDGPTLTFTHGAGGTLSAPAVVNFCTGFSTTLPILAFQGSMNLGSRVKGFDACISHLRKNDQEANNVLGGRSMGARAAVMAATSHLSASVDKTTPKQLSLILVSYPLKGPKDDIRDKILLDLPSSARVLFVIGDKDNMCSLDLLRTVRSKMKAKSQLVVVRGADHGMHVRPAEKEKQAGEEAGMLAAKWVNGEMEVDEEEIAGHA